MFVCVLFRYLSNALLKKISPDVKKNQQRTLLWTIHVDFWFFFFTFKQFGFQIKFTNKKS